MGKRFTFSLGSFSFFIFLLFFHFDLSAAFARCFPWITASPKALPMVATFRGILLVCEAEQHKTGAAALCPIG